MQIRGTATTPQQQQQAVVAPDTEQSRVDSEAPDSALADSQAAAAAAAAEAQRAQVVRRLYEEAWANSINTALQDSLETSSSSSSGSSSSSSQSFGIMETSSSSRSRNGSRGYTGDSGSVAAAAAGSMGGLYRQALGQGLADDVEADLMELQRDPAYIVREGKDKVVVHNVPEGSRSSSNGGRGSTSGAGGSGARDGRGYGRAGGSRQMVLGGIGSSSGGRESAAAVAAGGTSRGVGVGEMSELELSVGRCVVLHVPLTHAKHQQQQRRARKGEMRGSVGAPVWSGRLGGPLDSMELEEELAADLGEEGPAAAAAAAAAAMRRRRRVKEQQQQQEEGVEGGQVEEKEGDGSWAVWERAAREVVTRQVRLTGR